MSIFTKQDMWRVASDQMGLELLGYQQGLAVVLYTPEDVAELYKALQDAHWRAVDLYEKGIV